MTTHSSIETGHALPPRPQSFTSTVPLARRVRSATVGYFVAVVVQIGAFGWQFVVLQRLRSAGATDVTSLDALGPITDAATIATVHGTLNTTLNIAAGVHLLAMLALAVAFLTWQVRSRDNAPALGALGVRYGNTASVWAWVVPIWSLFGPKQVMNDLWRGSDPEAPMPVDIRSRPVPSWLLAWWLPTLLGLGLVTSRTFNATNTVAGAQTAIYLGASTAIAGVVGAVILIRLVRQVSDRQVVRARRFGVIAD